MKRTGVVRCAVMAGGILAAVLLCAAAVLFVLADLPVSPELFRYLGADKPLISYLSDRVMRAIPDTRLRRSGAFRGMVTSIISGYLAGPLRKRWKEALEHNRPDRLRLDFRGMKKRFCAFFSRDQKMVAAIKGQPDYLSLLRVAGMGIREKRLLIRFSAWYGKLRFWRIPALILPLLLIVAVLFYAPGRRGNIQAISFISSVIWIAMLVFLLVFRQQVVDLGLTVLAQISRNTVLEKAVVEGGIRIALIRLLRLSAACALFSFGLLLYNSFRVNRGEESSAALPAGTPHNSGS